MMCAGSENYLKANWIYRILLQCYNDCSSFI